MKYNITTISDTHNKHNQLNGKLPGGHILIHSGDITSLGRKYEVEAFIKWFDKQDYAHKVFIAGNHDMSFDREKLLRDKLAHFEGRYFTDDDEPCAEGKPQWLEEILNNLPNGMYYLENNSVKLEGINIWGSPVSPSFGYGWGFNKDRGHDINEVWSTIPMDTDIVITHSPIYGYNDRAQNTNENVGCADLYHRLHEVKPHLHFSGHIHEGYGWGTIPYKDEWGDIYTFNGSTCNLRYEAIQDPIKFNYDFVSREIEFLM
jgi:Icc-related predicted phosphoesterase